MRFQNVEGGASKDIYKRFPTNSHSHCSAFRAPISGRDIESAGAFLAAENTASGGIQIPLGQLIPIAPYEQFAASVTVRAVGGFIVDVADIGIANTVFQRDTSGL